MSPIDIAVAVAIGALLIVIAVVVISLLRSLKQPGADAIANALQPYVNMAIFAGEKLALKGMEDLGVELEGLDKKEIADHIYDVLPDVIWVGKIPVPLSAIKSIVPREQFEMLIKDAYERADGFVKKNMVYLKSQVDAFTAPATPSLASSGAPLTSRWQLPNGMTAVGGTSPAQTATYGPPPSSGYTPDSLRTTPLPNSIPAVPSFADDKPANG